MRILVTGNLGYLGVEMTPLLVGLGHDVVGLDTGYFDGCDFLAPPDPLPTLRIDVRDVTPADLVGFDAVVHLAALSNDPLSDIDPSLTYDINLAASVRLARAAKTAGVGRFVFSSSCSLYGAGSDLELDEGAPFNPVTPYGESKVRVEQELSRLADDDFTPVYLRNATAYGLSRRLRADVVVNNLLGHAVTTGKVLLQSDGTPWRPLVHVLDIAHAFAQVLTAPRQVVHDQAFNVGRVGENYQVIDIAQLVADIVPDCAVGHSVGATPDIRDYRVDFSKIERELPGYRPQWTLRRGIEQLWAAYSDGGMTAEQFEGPQFFRLRTIRQHLDRGRLDSDLRWVST
ncbi:SDR family oxidoreductase [Rhodococcus pseudokoreensis]|uniref:SDR family oxidoreductase n=1 Tax=Rhodococcus pseudokoreensis TaxID=2811421 RepID=A0A974WDN9_9NOCA|nr:SDR family oxidoreductase [Rhodococcus pseudokoreensis]MBV6761365.1 SDR family oxidoreductase [Rhodococcus opacus]QSE95432.1 SDR family oxidoreductase [Rhodococcus pseudokoreensis]